VEEAQDPAPAPKPGQRTLRRTPGFLLVAALLIAAMVATAVLRLRPNPGPLEPPLGRTAVESGTAIGTPWSAAAVDLGPFEGADAAVFDAVEAVGATGGIRVLGFRVVEPTIAGNVGIVAGFPPPGYTVRPVAGSRFTPGAPPPQIVVGVEATRNGRSSIAGFRLRYHIGNRAYVASFAQGVNLCVPDC
jgi:hypothetical protein